MEQIKGRESKEMKIQQKWRNVEKCRSDEEPE
jgi:hypothetical protein